MKRRSFWALGGAVVGVGTFVALGLAPSVALATPTPTVTSSVTDPVVGPVTYDCTSQSLNFTIAYPAGHITVAWQTPDGAGISASFADARTAPFNESLTLANGTYLLRVVEYPTATAAGVDFSKTFEVACAVPPPPTGGGTAVPTPTATATSTGNPVADHVVYCNTQSGKLQQGSEDAGHNPNLVKVGDIANIGGKWNPDAANAKWGAQCASLTKPTSTPTPSVRTTTPPSASMSPSATETSTPPKPSETPKPSTSATSTSASSSSAAVASATCAAGKVLSGDKCVVPAGASTGQGGTPGGLIIIGLLAVAVVGAASVFRWKTMPTTRL